MTLPGENRSAGPTEPPEQSSSSRARRAAPISSVPGAGADLHRDLPGQRDLPAPQLASSARANRIAIVGFGCSVASPLVFTLGLFAGEQQEGFLLGTSAIMLLSGLGFSIAGVAGRGQTKPRNHRLAVAGIVIAALAITAVPILLIWAFVGFMNGF